MLFTLENINVALLAFIPGLINLGIFIYSYYFLPKTRLSITFSLIVIAAFIWQIGEGFLRIIIDIELANRIYVVMNSSVLLLVSSCLYFSLLLTRSFENKNTSLIVSIIFFPAIVLIILNMVGVIPIEMKYTSSLGYIQTSKDLFNTIESLHLSIVGLFCAYIFISNWIKSRTKDDRAKIGLITVGFLIPLIQGLTTEIVFPEVLNINPVPLTTTSITFFSLASIIALKKFNLLSYSPYQVSDNIIEFMSDAVLISDNAGVIRYINTSLLKMFHYKKEELIGKQGYFILADKESVEAVSKMVPIRKTGSSNKYEVNMRTKEGNILNVLISASPYFKNNKVIGALAVIHDITSEKKISKEITEAMINGEEKERNRLAQELHDGVNQSIVAIKMRLFALQKSILKESNKEKVEDIINITQDAIDEVRKISHDLYPLKENESLSLAIKRLISRFQNTDIKFKLNIVGESPESVPGSIITNLYRVLQEFVNNSIKYANADLMTINLIYNDNKINLEVSDNGCGFDSESIINTSKGIGLQNMVKRVNIIGGSFDLHSEINVGSNIRVSVSFFND
ncbi:MAG: PAS domain S-box protein [Flavobacteriales bacterium]|nr:PAS domain S-box protein [Flavobacteriales bacterium]